MLFINARVILESGILQNGFVRTKGTKIVEVGECKKNADKSCCNGSVTGTNGAFAPKDGETVVDCAGDFISPGFIDIHTHGGGGFDNMDGSPEDIEGAALAHLKYGTTTYYPTTLTSSDEALFKTFDCFRQVKKNKNKLPHLPGLHLEGPFFDMVQKGAQDPRYIKNPKPENYMPILEKGEGIISRISFAPELPGALEMADVFYKAGIMMAAGHTAATYDEISKAYDHGVTHLTHFYSGMSGIERKGGFRILGTIEAGYIMDGLSIELIADGMHLPPDLLKMILKLKDHDHICICTDSMRGAGMPEGPSILGAKIGGQEVIIEGGIAKMPDRTSFAGSVCTMDRTVRTMVYKASLPMWKAVRMASLLPARFMGIEKKTGSISAGKEADLLIFDNDVNIKQVFVSGKKM
ncbi:N-acetylglucosamine-6-phosphate deacetylase [Treponema parvum]|uniref:N-acetylglucosamine-6-phosphate deacetylase n=1 Tax=Treponema parvum TaxID=138851 RepID=A0A975EYV4_9SPIR|nr:N-acetylglucosamine-6-phosphate deacetylase [Treponema parvum]QTQ11346.1 N-acetylglucosamine-6-phosphate deacetylase [Treponema parvum]